MVIGAGLEQRLAKNNWEIKFPALGKVHYLQQKPLWCDHSNLAEAPSVISVEVELRQTLSLLMFSFNK